MASASANHKQQTLCNKGKEEEEVVEVFCCCKVVTFGTWLVPGVTQQESDAAIPVNANILRFSSGIKEQEICCSSDKIEFKGQIA